MTVSWRNDKHPTGEVKPFYGILIFQLTTKLCNQMDTHLNIYK